LRSLETLAQSASRHMQPMEQQISLERVAEIMWQRGNDTDPAVKAHLAWLALPEDERRYWCDRAEAAIADWRSATARNRREAWSNLMERWFASRLTNGRHAAARDDSSPAAEVPAGSWQGVLSQRRRQRSRRVHQLATAQAERAASDLKLRTALERPTPRPDQEPFRQQ